MDRHGAINDAFARELLALLERRRLGELSAQLETAQGANQHLPSVGKKRKHAVLAAAGLSTSEAPWWQRVVSVRLRPGGADRALNADRRSMLSKDDAERLTDDITASARRGQRGRAARPDGARASDSGEVRPSRRVR